MILVPVLLNSSARKGRSDELWRHSRDPIRQPLLKKLANKDELREEACLIFHAVSQSSVMQCDKINNLTSLSHLLDSEIHGRPSQPEDSHRQRADGPDL